MSGIARILIVDDHSAIRETLKLILKNKYDVAAACDAHDAFIYMASCPVNIVLLDFKMPKIDGITALMEIKKRHPDTEVIMMTGYAPADAIQRAFNAGAFAFFMKPFDIYRLISAIEKALQKSESTRD
jgi:DNA-binding NtrC family response regulator